MLYIMYYIDYMFKYYILVYILYYVSQLLRILCKADLLFCGSKNKTINEITSEEGTEIFSTKFEIKVVTLLKAFESSVPLQLFWEMQGNLPKLLNLIAELCFEYDRRSSFCLRFSLSSFNRQSPSHCFVVFPWYGIVVAWIVNSTGVSFSIENCFVQRY